MIDIEKLKALAEAAQRHDNPDAFDTAFQFEAAANPAAVLELIESEQETIELCDALSGLLGGIAVAVRGPEEPKTRHGFSDLPSRVKTVVSERDQLKAENEALRKDAERYRWLLRSGRLSLWAEHLVCEEPRRSNGINTAIDAAMAQEQQP